MYLMFDSLLMGIWGLTMIDLVRVLKIGNVDILDYSIQTVLAIVGLLYLVFIKIPNEVRGARLKRRIAIAEAKKIEMENETYKNNHK